MNKIKESKINRFVYYDKYDLCYVNQYYDIINKMQYVITCNQYPKN